MARQTRVLLINPSGRQLLAALTAEYPEYMWVLMMKNDREVCIGLKDGIPYVFGSDYETIVDNLKIK